jgi:hypothetical protein
MLLVALAPTKEPNQVLASINSATGASTKIDDLALLLTTSDYARKGLLGS